MLTLPAGWAGIILNRRLLIYLPEPRVAEFAAAEGLADCTQPEPTASPTRGTTGKDWQILSDLDLKQGLISPHLVQLQGGDEIADRWRRQRALVLS